VAVSSGAAFFFHAHKNGSEVHLDSSAGLNRNAGELNRANRIVAHVHPDASEIRGAYIQTGEFMLLLFNNNFEYDDGDYICGPHSVDTKFVEAMAMIRRRDFEGRNSRAIVPPITVCNQNLRAIFEDKRMDRFIKGQE